MAHFAAYASRDETSPEPHNGLWTRPDVCNRQTDVRCASSLNASVLWGRGIISYSLLKNLKIVQNYMQAFPIESQ